MLKDIVLEKANDYYIKRKVKKGFLIEESIKYVAPEMLPKIESDQILAVIDTFAEILEDMGLSEIDLENLHQSKIDLENFHQSKIDNEKEEEN